MTNKPIAYRVRFESDADARFEECNGENRPLTREEYRKNEYYACPNHLRGWKGNDSSAFGVGICGMCQTQYAPVPYAEYLAYYGNPERHVYLGVIVEQQCGCCQSWTVANSLWNIDFMDDSREFAAVTIARNLTPVEALALPGYAGEVAREQLEDAGYIA